MSYYRYFVRTLIFAISGLLSIGSSVENKLCFNVSNPSICYFRPKEALTNTVKQWEEARSICQGNSATLPIIENQEIQNAFEHYLSNILLNTNDIWLGGRQEVAKKEWQWSNKKPFNQPDLIADGDQNQKNIAVIQRSSNSGSPSTATLIYVAALPSWFYFHICQYSASRCPTDNSTIQNEHHGCIRVFNKRESNSLQAIADCNTSGGHLATFDGDEYLTKAPEVYAQMQPHRPQYYTGYYIGLQRIDTKSWFWTRSNNESSKMEGNYENYSDRNNNSYGDCLFASGKDHRWEASRCDVQKRFICQTIETQAREKEPSGNLALIVGLSVGITLLAAIIILIVIIAIQRKNLRSITENEETLQNRNRSTAYEQEADHYEELTHTDDYAELTQTDNYIELIL